MATSAQYEVHAVRYATRTTVRSELLLNFHAYGEPDAPARLDYYFWVVRNARRVVLVDCGFAPEVGERRGRQTLVAPTAALGSLGVAPHEVAQLVLTHAHYDHVGNVPAFPGAELVVARRELDFWLGPYAWRPQLGAYTERAEVAALARAAQDGRATLFSGRHELAPGIDVVEVGGHTPGQAVVVVATTAGPVVLASDAVHLYEEVERDRPYSVVSDVVATYRAYDLIRELTSAPGSTLVAGHDPAVMTRFATPDGALDGVAVRIA